MYIKQNVHTYIRMYTSYSLTHDNPIRCMSSSLGTYKGIMGYTTLSAIIAPFFSYVYCYWNFGR